jgi:cell division protein FtsI/penicillin-binding protein 2
VANEGTVWRPHVVAAVRDPDGGVDRVTATRLGRLDVDDATMRVLRWGLRGVTARGGTAESRTQPFALFAGYAPAADPRYVWSR